MSLGTKAIRAAMSSIPKDFGSLLDLKSTGGPIFCKLCAKIANTNKFLIELT